MSNAAAPTLEEGVELMYAVVARLATDHGVRALAIKGPLLSRQGLRSPRQSVDVDLLIEPSGVPVMQSALEEIGWHDAFFYDTPVLVPHHSVTHRHPQWPCEVDVHLWFPGFLADPQEVFDVLWDRRVVTEFAHCNVPATDSVASAAIAALHHLRDASSTYRQQQIEDLARRVESAWTAEQLADLSSLAADTGSVQTLRSFLQRIGAPQIDATRPSVVDLADWEIQSGKTTSEVLPWLVGLRRTVWYRRPGFVWRAVWLGEDRFRLWDPNLPLTHRAVMMARWRRLVRALRALPRARSDLRRLQNGPDE